MEENIEKKSRKRKKKTESLPPRSSPPPSLRPFTIPKTGNKGKKLYKVITVFILNTFFLI